MRLNKRVMTILVAAAASTAGFGALASEPPHSGASEIFEPDRPWEVIDVAIALDTSTSMDVLIETARLRLWEIVQDLTLLDPEPTLRVALISFGNFANERNAGWVRVESDFTQDLDLVSDRLFELTSGGGEEYVGRVLKTALELSWTPSDEALKLVFVAGNEPATQDPVVTLEELTNAASEAGVSLHVIFCGQEQSPDAESWRQFAEVAAGQFAVIDHRASPIAIETPFDAELAELGKEINRTYIPLGEEGQERQQRLAERDDRVQKASPATAAARAEVKSSRLYSSGWDLVDAVASGEKDLYDLDESQLPETVRAMSLAERESYVSEMQVSRQELRERIAQLSEQRRAFVAKELEAKGLERPATFDTVVRQAIREQLEERGFKPPAG